MLQCSAAEALHSPDQGPRDPGGLAQRCPFSPTTTTTPLQSRPSLAPEAAFPGAEPGCSGGLRKRKKPWAGCAVEWGGEVKWWRVGGGRGGALTMLSESRRSALRADVCVFFCLFIYRRASLTLWPKAGRERAEWREKRPEREIRPEVKEVGANLKMSGGMEGLADIVRACGTCLLRNAFIRAQNADLIPGEGRWDVILNKPEILTQIKQSNKTFWKRSEKPKLFMGKSPLSFFFFLNYTSAQWPVLLCIQDLFSLSVPSLRGIKASTCP